MENDTPLQEDPRNQADESHLRDCAGAGAQLGAVGGQGAMQNLHLPSHSPRFALPASISCELQAGARNPKNRFARDYLKPDLDLIYYTIIL